MKLRNKSKLVWNDGYITTKKGKLVALPDAVQDELDMLEVKVEQNFHEQEQPKPVEPKPFKRLGLELPLAPIRIETPLLDQKVEESMALMKEIDDANSAERLKRLVERDYPNLARFVAEDKFVSGTRFERFNLPMIENPLELTEEKFLAWVLATFAEVDDE
jgi:hypothetical protein